MGIRDGSLLVSGDSMRREAVGELEEPSSRSARRFKLASLVLGDVLAGVLAASVSYVLTNAFRQSVGFDPIAIDSAAFRLHLFIITSLTLTLLIWFRSKGHYQRRQALADQMGSVLAGVFFAMMCAVMAQFATVEVGSRVLTLSYWGLLFPFLLLGRFMVRRGLKAVNAWSSPAVLFTCVTRSAELNGLIQRRNEIGAQVTSLVTINDLSVDELIAEMAEASVRGFIVIYAPSSGDPVQPRITEALVLRGVPFMLSPQLGPVPDHAEVLSFPPEDLTLMEIRDPLSRPMAKACKRTFDVVLAGLALIALSPLLVPIMLMIRADGGPAFFRQKRVGRYGEVFDCLKFRSMRVDAEDALKKMIEADPVVAAEWKTYQKLARDPRITPVGRLIRKTNLDELPQLINVLRGDMSLVGPRPMTVPQIGEYGVQFAAYKRMRPGITGMWQVNGRNQTTFTERARLDAFYVRNWSLWRDVVILVRTVREVVFARGA